MNPTHHEPLYDLYADLLKSIEERAEREFDDICVEEAIEARLNAIDALCAERGVIDLDVAAEIDLPPFARLGRVRGVIHGRQIAIDRHLGTLLLPVFVRRTLRRLAAEGDIFPTAQQLHFAKVYKIVIAHIGIEDADHSTRDSSCLVRVQPF